MIKFIVEILIMGLIVYFGAHLVPGIDISGFGSSIIAAILIALANSTIGLILRILTFPINFLTLGLMSFIISVLMVLLVSRIMEGFEANGFLSAAIFSIIIAILKAIISSFRSE